MKSILSKKSLSRIYLLLVPFLVIILGFTLGKKPYTFYLPIWIANVCLMLLASWILGLHIIQSDRSKKQIVFGAFFLLVPTMLISMFFGLGPPPETASKWVETATEQQVRYAMLTAAGIFIVFGLSLLREGLKIKGENFYSLLGYTSILIALPLFILDMLFWGFALTASFKIVVTTDAEKFPEWFKPLRELFKLIAVTEVALTYFATAAYAMALYRVGWLRKPYLFIFLIISVISFLIIVGSTFLPEPFVTAGYLVSIPAIPFLLLYFIGILLLTREGKTPILAVKDS